MEMLAPRYMESAGFGNPEVHYMWDDWNVESAELPVREDVLASLQRVSRRANIAYTTGCAEWIVHRFEGLCDDELPLEAIQAAWAQVVDVRYGVPWNPFDDGIWTGPVLGPIRRGMMWLRVVVQLASEGSQNSRCSSRIAMLTEFLVPNRSAFLEWQRDVLSRLVAQFPFDPVDPLGDVIPRQALNPDFDFKTVQTEQLINSFLSNLDVEDNGFLCTPDEMKAEGFNAVPYRFELAEDRQTRVRG